MKRFRVSLPGLLRSPIVVRAIDEGDALQKAIDVFNADEETEMPDFDEDGFFVGTSGIEELPD